MHSRLFSHSYAKSTRVFKVFNLPDRRIEEESGYEAILHKILHRSITWGKPSSYIKEEVNRFYLNDDDKDPKFLALNSSKYRHNWTGVIKGSKLYNPAQDFYEKLASVPLIQSLIYPECPVTEILDFESAYSEFHSEQVDFYLPQCSLIIEYDGNQHEGVTQSHKDVTRDEYFRRAGIKTIRIKSGCSNSENEKEVQTCSHSESLVVQVFF